MDKHKELNLREGLGGRKFNFSNCEQFSSGRLYGKLSFTGGPESSK